MLKSTQQEFSRAPSNDLINSKTKLINTIIQPKKPVFNKFNKISKFAKGM